jgi:FAD/FMN-containing dehydrogenase
MSQTVPLPTVSSYPAAHQGRDHEAEDLAAQLRQTIRGEVRFDEGSRALYAADLSMYRQVPIGVVVPRDLDDVIATVAACRERGVPILGRGCGTSLAGQCCNVAVVIDFSKYVNHISELDPERRTVWVEPGVICDQLRNAAEEHHLTLAPDPATHEYCTLGGMIGNNSCGSHSVMGGKTSENTEELEILTYDGLRLRVGPTSEADLESIIAAGGRRGEIYRRLRDLRDRYAGFIRTGFPHIPRQVSGYNLEALLPENGFHVARALVGSESTCVLVLGARMRLMHSPPFRSLVVIGYANPFQAGDHVPSIMENHPIALEAFTSHVIENMRRKGRPVPGAHLLPEGNTWLLAEFGGESEKEVTDRAREALARLKKHSDIGTGVKVLTDPAEQKAVWKTRESGVGASRIPHVEDAFPSWEDSAVPPEKLGDYLRDFVKLLHRYDYDITIFRCRWARRCCCRPCGRRRRTPSSSAMVSVAAARSSRGPIAKPCTWPRSFSWPSARRTARFHNGIPRGISSSRNRLRSRSRPPWQSWPAGCWQPAGWPGEDGDGQRREAVARRIRASSTGRFPPPGCLRRRTAARSSGRGRRGCRCRCAGRAGRSCFAGWRRRERGRC